MSDSLQPTTPIISRTTRRGHHLAPSMRAGRRQTRRQARYKAPKWGLSLTGFWLLCSACSFNNSFQEGCIGSIRIQVPPDHKQAKKTNPKSKAPSLVIAKLAPSDEHPDEHPPAHVDTLPETTQALAQAAPSQGTAPSQGFVAQVLTVAEATPESPKTSAPSTIKDLKPLAALKKGTQEIPAQQVKDLHLGLWMLPALAPSKSEKPAAARKKQVAKELCPPAQKVAQAPKKAIPSGLAALRKHTLSGGVHYSWQLLRRLLRAEAQMPQTKSWSGRARTMLLQSDVPEAIWQERPAQIHICFDQAHNNKGWNQPHPAQNTAALNKRCQSGHALGQGKHWFVLSDTFAASATSCRVFFSPGRLAVIAECGDTLYRASIRSFASCLQQRKNCEIPQMALQRLPQQSQQTVELQRAP
ncbi:MAG: hypothetical protein H6728_14130 [Myxococcales bacterium]|nr:hypothetical protein [Myxococcales bacterium]